MASSSSSSSPQPKIEVFQVSLSVERQWVKEVVRAILGTILFQRAVGNIKPRSMDVCGVTFPVPADPDVEALINNQTDALYRLALEQSSSSTSPKSSRLFLSFYPTPKSPKTSAPTPKARAPPLATALGWFSASTKAFVGGEDESGSAESEEDFGKVWEGWVVEIEMVSESRRGPAGAAEEKLRSQLNDFLLKTLMFVSEKTAHVPPITSSDVQPFGVQILVNPSAPPFPIPKAIIQAPSAFPLLHKTLVKAYRPTATA